MRIYILLVSNPYTPQHITNYRLIQTYGGAHSGDTFEGGWGLWQPILASLNFGLKILIVKIHYQKLSFQILIVNFHYHFFVVCFGNPTCVSNCASYYAWACKVLVSWGFNVQWVGGFCTYFCDRLLCVKLINACEFFQLRRKRTVVIHEFCTHDDPCNGCRAHAPGV